MISSCFVQRERASDGRLISELVVQKLPVVRHERCPNLRAGIELLRYISRDKPCSASASRSASVKQERLRTCQVPTRTEVSG